MKHQLAVVTRVLAAAGLSLAVSLAQAGESRDTETKWVTDYQAALEQARKEDRPVFIFETEDG